MNPTKIYPPYLDDHGVNGEENVYVSKNSVILKYPCPGETICSPYVLVLDQGRYLFEVWGAQGGGKNSGFPIPVEGGKGGYSKGKFRLTEKTKFYVYVGSSGTFGGNGGYNGGGAVGGSMWVDTNYNDFRTPGGGATDIRKEKGQLISLKSYDFDTTYYGPETSLKSRVIVAGGGGGLADKNGYGGGEHGFITGTDITSGNQTHAGKTYHGIDAGFGYGGYTDQREEGISGGGGGYYGGGASLSSYGGSGFVDTSFFYFCQTIAGDQMIPSPFGGYQPGHSGDGVAKITYLEMFADCTQKSNIIQFRFSYLIIVTLVK